MTFKKSWFMAKDAGLAVRLMILAGILMLAAVLIGAIGMWLFDSSLATIVIALVACLVAALLAHIAGEHPRGDLYFAARLALQMAARTVPPLIVAVWGLHFAAPPFDSDLVCYMILLYIVGLIVDVQLTLGRLSHHPPTERA